jgi:hypothetical protein
MKSMAGSVTAAPPMVLPFLRADSWPSSYPRGYRREHGPEILATLAKTSRPGRIPPVREIVGLLRGGLATRPRHAAQGPVPWWADGVHLGIRPGDPIRCGTGHGAGGYRS